MNSLAAKATLQIVTALELAEECRVRGNSLATTFPRKRKQVAAYWTEARHSAQWLVVAECFGEAYRRLADLEPLN